MIPLNRNLAPLQRSGIRRYTNLARATEGCVMLTIGEPDFDTPSPICEAAVNALGEKHTHYAMNQGQPDLRRAIAEFETKRGMSCRDTNVLVTVGATGALFTALLGILNPGEEVIVPIPAFSLYETIITVAGAKMVPLDITKSGFQIRREDLLPLITPKTKAIILNSPNNPTGVVLGESSLRTVKEAIMGRDIFLVCDNVYNQLVYADMPDISLDRDLREQLLYCQSFSKPYAMTGWRVGYLVCPEYVMDRLLLLSAAQIAAVPTFLQDAAITALGTDPRDMVEVYRRRRDYVCRRLSEMGLSYPKPEGAFYVFADIRKFDMDDDTFCTRMILDGKVAAVPGGCFGTPGFIRLSYCCSDQALALGLDRLETFLKGLN